MKTSRKALKSTLEADRLRLLSCRFEEPTIFTVDLEILPEPKTKNPKPKVKTAKQSALGCLGTAAQFRVLPPPSHE